MFGRRTSSSTSPLSITISLEHPQVEVNEIQPDGHQQHGSFRIKSNHRKSRSIGSMKSLSNAFRSPGSSSSSLRSPLPSPAVTVTLEYNAGPSNPNSKKRRSANSSEASSSVRSKYGSKSIGRRNASSSKRPGIFSIFGGRSNNNNGNSGEGSARNSRKRESIFDDQSTRSSRGKSQSFALLRERYNLTSPESWRQAFFDSVSNGDETKCRLLWELYLIDSETFPNALDMDKMRDPSNGNTALIAACSHNQHTIAAMIMYEMGGSPLAENNFQSTALHYACSGGWEETVILLLENPRVARECKDKRDFFGYSCLHLAVISGHYGVVEILIRAGVNIELPVLNRGVRAIHLAVEQWDLRMLELLLEQGKANVSSKDGDHSTPLMRSITLYGENRGVHSNRKIEIMESLLCRTTAKVMANSRHRQGNRNLLQLAADVGCNTFFQLFFNAAPFVVTIQLLKDTSDARSWTPLHYAAKNCNIRCADAIIHHLSGIGLNPGDCSEKQRSKKSKKGKEGPAEYLKSVLKQKDNKGNTALHLILLELRNMENVLNPRMSMKIRESALRKYPTNLIEFLEHQDRFIQLATKLIAAGSNLKTKNKTDNISCRNLIEELGLQELLPSARDSFRRGLFRVSRNLKFLGSKREPRHSIRASVSFHIASNIETYGSDGEDDDDSSYCASASATPNMSGLRCGSGIEQLQMSSTSFIADKSSHRRSRRDRGGRSLFRVGSFLRGASQAIAIPRRNRDSVIKISM